RDLHHPVGGRRMNIRAGEAQGPVQGDPRLTLPASVLEQVRVRAEGAYPEECCGLLIGLRDGDSVLVRRELPCPNAVRGADRQRRFAIHPKALLNVMRALRDREESVVEFYHSHPDAEATLSATDLTFVGLWPDTVWLVVPVGEEGAGDERAWWLPSAARDTTTPLELPVRPASPGGQWS